MGRRSLWLSLTPRELLSQTSLPRVRSSSRTLTNPSSLRPMSREFRMVGKTPRRRLRTDFSSSMRPRKLSLDMLRTVRLLPLTLRRQKRRSRRLRRSSTLRLLMLISPRDRKSLRTLMTTHTEADTEVAALKGRFDKVKAIAETWVKKCEVLVKEWVLLDNTVTELNSWVAKDKSAEGENQFSLEKMESTLGELK